MCCSCGQRGGDNTSEGVSPAIELSESDSIVESIAKHVFGEDIIQFVDSDVHFSYEDSVKLHSAISNYPNLIKIAMQSTLIKDIVSDINIVKSCIETNPIIVELEEINPGFRHFINDPDKLQEVISILQDSESYVDFPRTKKVIQTMVEKYIGRKLVFKSELSSKRLQSSAADGVGAMPGRGAVQFRVDSQRVAVESLQLSVDSVRSSIDSIRSSPDPQQPSPDPPQSPIDSPLPSANSPLPYANSPRSPANAPQSPAEERVRNDKLRDLMHSCNHHSVNHLHHTLREMIAHANTDHATAKNDTVVRNPWKELETLDDPSIRQDRNGRTWAATLRRRVH